MVQGAPEALAGSPVPRHVPGRILAEGSEAAALRPNQHTAFPTAAGGSALGADPTTHRAQAPGCLQPLCGWQGRCPGLLPCGSTMND